MSSPAPENGAGQRLSNHTPLSNSTPLSNRSPFVGKGYILIHPWKKKQDIVVVPIIIFSTNLSNSQVMADK